MTIWEEEIGKVEEDECYCMHGMMVREFRGKKFLSTSKEECIIKKIDDIGSVEENSENEDDGGLTNSENEDDGGLTMGMRKENVRVIGVDRIDRYDSCLKCGGRVRVDEEDDAFCECEKCEMFQDKKECKKMITALLTLKSKNGERLYMRAFEQVLKDITGKSSSEEVTAKELIKAKQFNVVCRDGVMTSITRKVAI